MTTENISDSNTSQRNSARHCGFVAIVGRPNVGKSTLLNHLLGQKISITSRRAQTTRDQILGVHTEGNKQTVFVDTPGLQQEPKKAINRYMNRAAKAALTEVDLILLVSERLKWSAADEAVLENAKKTKVPIVLVINKIDQIDDKERLLTHIHAMHAREEIAKVIPVSATRNSNMDELAAVIDSYLPESDFYFDEDQITDRSQRFLAAEMIREKVMRQLGDEVPYALAVEIEEFTDSGKSLHIHALLIVEREGQKKILIGTKGERLKNIGQQARIDMEKLFERKVMLRLWVKVKSGWSDDERALRSLGYSEFD